MPARPHPLHQGFSPLIELEDQEAFSARVRDWPKLKPHLEVDACELQSNYVVDGQPRGSSVDG